MEGWTNDSPVRGDRGPQWLLAAQQLPPGSVSSPVPKQPIAGYQGTAGPGWPCRRCPDPCHCLGDSPCSKGGDVSQGRGQVPGACTGWCNAEKERNKCGEEG